MIESNLNGTFKGESPNINELQNKKIQILEKELEEKNKKIYDLIQKNENLIISGRYQEKSEYFREKEIENFLKEFHYLKKIIEQKEMTISGLSKTIEENEILSNELISQKHEIQELHEKIEHLIEENDYYKCTSHDIEKSCQKNICIKNMMEEDLKKKDNIIEQLIEENKQLLMSLNEMGKKKPEICDLYMKKEKNKNEERNDGYLVEIEYLKEKIIEMEKKKLLRKKKQKSKIDKLKRNYLSYLEEYEKRHLSQITQMKEKNDSIELEMQKILLENEHLKEKNRNINEEKNLSANEIIKKLEQTNMSIENKIRDIQNQVLEKDFELKKIKGENALLKNQLGFNEKNKQLKNIDDSTENKDLVSFIDETDNDFLLSIIKEKVKNENYFRIIEKKFQENTFLKNEVLSLQQNNLNLQKGNEIFEKENISYKQDIYLLHKKLNEQENIPNKDQEIKLNENNIEINKGKIQKRGEINNENPIATKYIKKQEFPKKLFVGYKSKEKTSNKYMMKNIPRYEDFEEMET